MGAQLQNVALGDALFGKAQRRVLALLLGRADERFYLRQIARVADMGMGAIQRELARLCAAGLLVREQEGRQTYYRANRDAPVFDELQGLIRKTAGLADVLREGLAPLGDRIAIVVVSGSFAEGRERAASDVDLLVVGDVAFAEVVDALAPAEHRLGREINPIVYPPAEFKGKLRVRHHFLTSLLKRPKLFVLGDARELERLAGASVG